MKTALLSLLTLGLARAQEFLPIRYEPPKIPEDELARLDTRQVNTLWITQLLDHFDPSNDVTWQMRYMENGQFFERDGAPIYILVGGEWSISSGWLLGGTMFLSAQENGAYMFYTEHRYYGESRPFNNTETENLKFLNVDQALADLAYFIRNLKTQSRFANSKVILFGGSYAANMVIWFKMRYRHLVHGGLASSGPILAKSDFSEYLDVVHDAFESEGGPQCIDAFRQAIDEMKISILTPEGRQNLTQSYRLCEVDQTNLRDLERIFSAVTWTLSGSVQTASIGSLIPICNYLLNPVNGERPFHRLGRLIMGTSTVCWNSSFDALLTSYQSTAWSESRLWYYQTCTEYGFYQTGGNTGRVFDGLLSLEFYYDICRAAFGDSFNGNFVERQVDRSNIVFGALTPEVDNIINVHGLIDPWHALGQLDDLGPTSTTILVPRASHCFDLYGWTTADTTHSYRAKQTIRRIISEWIRQ